MFAQDSTSHAEHQYLVIQAVKLESTVNHVQFAERLTYVIHNGTSGISGIYWRMRSMVKATVTTNCNSHRYNNSYPTMLIIFDGKDSNIRPLGLIGNWQPTDLEGRAFVKILASVSPTFAEWLIQYVLEDLNRHSARQITDMPITNLAEVLL